MDYLHAPDRIETPEFTIRCYWPGDGPLLSEAVNNSYEHLRTFMPWAKPYQSVEEEEQFVRKSCGNYLLANNFTLGIFAPDGKRLLGGTGFHCRNIPLSERVADIGMWIRAEEAHKGLGTRVLVTLLRWGFSEWLWLRLTWHCDAENLASARTAQKAGMIQEGRLRSDAYHPGTLERRDTLIFAALKDEWKFPG